MPTYASVGEIKSQMKAVTTNDDVKVLRLARAASMWVDRQFQSKRPYFFPYSEARQFRLDGYGINTWDNTFKFADNLLSLTSLSVNSNSVSAVEAYPTLSSPSHYLRLTNDYDSWWNYCNSTSVLAPSQATITGVWGMHRDYANAWLQVDTLSAAITTTTATSMTVSDVDGYDDYNWSPRISAGHLVKIDSEYIEIAATNTQTNACTIRRGVFGTTAAAHLINAPVYVFQVEEAIRGELARQVGYMYARQGAYESAMMADSGIAQFPPSVVGSLEAAIAGFAYE